MVGDTRPVERRLDLDLEARRVLDGLALEILVGLAGIGDAVAEEPGIQRPAGVDVGLTEVGLAVGILRLGEGRRRQPAHESGYQCRDRDKTNIKTHRAPSLKVV
jgi:hypothetical protein